MTNQNQKQIETIEDKIVDEVQRQEAIEFSVTMSGLTMPDIANHHASQRAVEKLQRELQLLREVK
tara:strand:+ start:139 stop:333 length:195 start_codon:yes stop_codon:yes gene_type:complete